MDETMREQPTPAGGFCAFLRLRQGASARATWILEETSGGTMISVGADAACDWQIRAAFVPARAFSLLIVGGRTFVRTGAEPGVLLNGKQVDDGWVEVPHGGRIDVGLARLEVTMGYGDTSGQLVHKLEQIEQSTRRTVSQIKGREQSKRSVGRTTMNLGAIPITRVEQDAHDSHHSDAPDNEVITLERPASKRPLTTQPVTKQPRKAPLNATMELQLEDLYMDTGAGAPRNAVSQPRRAEESLDQGAFGQDVDGVPQARMLGQQSGEFDVGALPHEEASQGAPSLLDVEEPADKRRWWMYAVAGVATAGAYGGWLMLLDRF